MGTIFIGSDQEVYIPKGNYPNGDARFAVIRPVTVDALKEYQDIEYYIKNERYLWVEAVKADKTDQSLREFFEEAMLGYTSGEAFLFKDDSYCEVLNNISSKTGRFLREDVDEYFDVKFGVYVGTWECSGWMSKPENVKFVKSFNYK